jgi:hypothetical protein
MDLSFYAGFAIPGRRGGISWFFSHSRLACSRVVCVLNAPHFGFVH